MSVKGLIFLMLVFLMLARGVVPRFRWGGGKERAGGGDSGRGRHRLAGSLVVRGDVHFLPRGERLRQKKGLLDDFKDN